LPFVFSYLISERNLNSSTSLYCSPERLNHPLIFFTAAGPTHAAPVHQVTCVPTKRPPPVTALCPLPIEKNGTESIVKKQTPERRIRKTPSWKSHGLRLRGFSPDVGGSDVFTVQQVGGMPAGSLSVGRATLRLTEELPRWCDPRRALWPDRSLTLQFFLDESLQD